MAVLLPGSPLKFLGTPLFTAGAKLRLLAEPFIGAAPAEAEESVAEFVLRWLGRDFLDYAINPMVGGVYAGDPARLSVKHAFPKLHAVEQRYRSLIAARFSAPVNAAVAARSPSRARQRFPSTTACRC